MATFMLSYAAMATLFLAATTISAEPTNDFCVADLTMTDVTFDGLPCKPPSKVTPDDFKFKGFRATADTNNTMGVGIIPGFAAVNYAALNAQGFALAKINYAKHGLVAPHTHPRAAEIITVTKGEVYVGFVCTAGMLWAATLKQGDFFVFPKGLVHFQMNVYNGQSATLSVLNAQSPGIQMVGNALFASTPPVRNAVLNKAFMISNETTDWIRSAFTAPPASSHVI